MPEYYLRGGNGRILYMLKTFTLKMLDVYHNEVGLMFKTNPAQAMKNLVRLTSALIVMGVGVDWLKDFLLGRAKDLSDYATDNILKAVGLSKWTIYKAKQEGVELALLQTILPPSTIVSDLIKDVNDISFKRTKELSEARIWGKVPLVGKFYYWWFGGGQQKTKRLSIV
jgi:hypothetical protein